MAWIVLFLAGLLEIGWAIGLKHANGFTRLLPSLLTAVSMVASLGLLGLALKTLPLGTAYAIWTGIGTVGSLWWRGRNKTGVDPGNPFVVGQERSAIPQQQGRFDSRLL